MNIAHWGIVDGNDLVSDRITNSCVLLNDFQCAGYSLNGLKSEHLQILRHGRISSGNVKVMIGVGTGLGVSFATEVEGLYVPCSSEAGWVQFSPQTSIDSELMAYVQKANGWASLGFEQVCSGRAISMVYDFICQRNGKESDNKTPDKICSSFKVCPNSRMAVQLTLGYLGRFISQLSLIFKPMGGFFLCGGLMDRLRPIIEEDSSFENGLDTQPASILTDIANGPSIFYISVPDVGLIGARESCYAFKNIK